jgi:hypothetical protein
MLTAVRAWPCYSVGSFVYTKGTMRMCLCQNCSSIKTMRAICPAHIRVFFYQGNDITRRVHITGCDAHLLECQ